MRRLPVLAALVFGAGCGGAREDLPGTSAETNTTRPNGGKTMTEKAMFGAGCFWGVEAAFREVDGVVDTAVGYSGGKAKNPSYEDVCSHTTGHAEVVEVTFDPSATSYEQLLDVFWRGHDPTQVNRQGPDVGSQYRSAIFYLTPEQQAAARASKEKLEIAGKHRKPIATEITAASAFWRAEEYHQRYVEKHGGVACHVPHDE
jgi:peptide-methionine (S)-S-oxide reductase